MCADGGRMPEGVLRPPPLEAIVGQFRQGNYDDDVADVGNTPSLAGSDDADAVHPH